jgi:hypothetical protein
MLSSNKNMKTGPTILQTLLLAGTILAASSVSQPALAATLTAGNKTTLDAAATTTISTTVTTIINTVTTPADKADLAKQIVAYLAGKAGMTAVRLQAAVKAAVQAAGAANAPSIATAAAQAAVNSGNAAALVSAVAAGAIQGGGVAADIQATLSGALPVALGEAIKAGVSEGRGDGNPIVVLPTGGNPTETSVSTPPTL